MTKVRVFYGNGEPAHPLGYSTREDAPDTTPATTDAEADVDRPNSSWTVPELDDWAEANGVTGVDGLKADKLAALQTIYDSKE